VKERDLGRSEQTHQQTDFASTEATTLGAIAVPELPGVPMIQFPSTNQR